MQVDNDPFQNASETFERPKYSYSEQGKYNGFDPFFAGNANAPARGADWNWLALYFSTMQAQIQSGSQISAGKFTSATIFNLYLPNMLQGSVLFAGAGGLVTQNNTNFTWDDTNATLKIGTTHAISTAQTYIKFPNLDSGVASFWNISQGWFMNTAGRNDTMFFMGYNVNPSTGGRLLNTEPLWAWHLETYESSTDPGVPYVEGHLSYIGTSGNTRRPFDCRINLATDVCATSLTGDRILMQDSTLARIGLSVVVTSAATSWVVGVGGNGNSNVQFHVYGTQLLQSNTAAADNKYWEISPALGASARDFAIRAVNDAYSTAGIAMYVSRAGTSTINVGFRTAPNSNVSNHFLGTFLWESPTGAANNKYWDIDYGAGAAFNLRAVNDAYGAAGTALSITRSGATVSNFQVGAALLAITDASYDCGASGATRFKDFYCSNKFLAPNVGGTTPGFAFVGFTTSGMGSDSAFGAVSIINAGTAALYVGSAGIYLGTGTLNWSSVINGAPDLSVTRDGAANILAQKNSTNAQTFRVYGTTTGPKYVTLKHDGTDATVDTAAASGKLILGGNATDIQWGTALVALGGGAAPTLGTIGGTGPATAAQNTWMQVKDSAGNKFWVPAWK